MPISHFCICWITVKCPIRNAVSNNHSFHVELECDILLLIMLINKINEKWNINSSVGFTSYIQVQIFIFWIFFKPLKNYLKGIISCAVVIKCAVLFCFTSWVTYSRWHLNVKNAGFFVPRVWIFSKLCGTIIKNKWSMFFNECQHWGTSRATIEPNKKRIIRPISLTFS
jgi:hypothetical protein